MKVGGLAIVCAFVLIACVGPLAPPSPPRQTNMGLHISSFALPNGFRVVLVHDPRAHEVQVTTRYQVGSIDDGDHAGIAHMVEHLMFQQVLGGDSLFARLQNIATYFNGTTTLDATTYVARALPAHLDELLSIEAVRVGFRCTSITDDAFVRERSVVMQEVRLRDAGSELIGAINSGLYPAGHPYTHRTGGTEETVGAITRDQACAFADAHYAPQNAVLVVSGNVTPKQLETSLNRFLAKTPKRSATTATVVPPLPLVGRKAVVPAPVDDKLVIVAWPLPAELRSLTQIRAIAGMAATLIDSELTGRVQLVQFGDLRAPMLGIVIAPGKNESVDDVIHGAERGVKRLPELFETLGHVTLGQALFERIQQAAIYERFAGLEAGSDRDERLATLVLAGHDPSTAVGEELGSLRELTRGRAAAQARAHLGFERATIVVLEPSETTKRGRAASLDAPIHEMGLRRDQPDPADAHHPASATPATGYTEIKTRTLPNGLRIMLLPVTSVPTIDVRLVFNSGTADEPTAKAGAALLAANALTWDFHYLNDYLLFAAAGGTTTAQLDLDRTTFAVHGLDMHLDILLAGLRRWVRNGKYDDDAATVLEVLRREAKRSTDDGSLTDAWRTAVYGAGHPYVVAGRVRYAALTLDADDARQFRAAHYTPDNATLVIAGRFDAALADRWIDFLFADWTGHAEPRAVRQATVQPVSIAHDEATSQVRVDIALPATGTRARQLVAAAMLSDIATDVRHQLGASYAIDAQLAESRLSTTYVIAGWIDASRARDAIELIRARFEQLRTDADATARAFVAARTRVITHLTGAPGNAGGIADRVQSDVTLSRALLSDQPTASEVQQLTIEGMTTTLAELDLARAAILIRGPAPEVDAAFAVLGRTATRPVKKVDDDDPLFASKLRQRTSSKSISLSDLSDPLAAESPPGRLRIAAVPFAYSTGRVLRHGVSGYAFAGAAGLRLDRSTVVGLELSIGKLSGRYDTGLGGQLPDLRPISLVPVAFGAFVQANGYDRIWGSAMVGLHANRVTDDTNPTSWDPSIGFGLEGGVDILELGRHRFGVYGRIDGEVLTGVSYTGFVVGLAYRL